MDNLTPLERELLEALERVLPALNLVIDSFTLVIPGKFNTLAEDVAAAEEVVRKARQRAQ